MMPVNASGARCRLHRREGRAARPRPRRGGRAGRQLAYDPAPAGRGSRRARGDDRRARAAPRPRGRSRDLPRGPGEPAPVVEGPGIHGADEPRRGAPRGAGRGRPDPRDLRQLVARLRTRPAGRRGRGSALRAPGRPRAPLEDLRRAMPAALRRRRAHPAAGHRLWPEPRAARRARVADRRRQVPPPRRRGRAAPARRRRARHDRRRARRGRGADPARRRRARRQRRRRDGDRRAGRGVGAGRGRLGRPGARVAVHLPIRLRAPPAVRLVVTGATGFLGWRATVVLRERGHDVLAVARPGGAERAHARGLEDVAFADVADPAARELLAERDAVLHFAGMPGPRRSREDPATATALNAGRTANLPEAGVRLVYPSSLRAGLEPPPDPYALSKRLGEEACRLHATPATVVRLPSVFGPGQVAWEGATGAISAFAARALTGEPIVIPGDPERTRDFVYVDDMVAGLETIVAEGRWNETLAVGSGEPTALRRAAELVLEAAGSDVPVQLPGGELPPGEGQSYALDRQAPLLGLPSRPLEAAISDYVAWLRAPPAAQGRARA